MSLRIDDDVTTLEIRLKELRSTFDQAMRQEDSFIRVKELYAEIKELEYYLSVMNWDARTYRAHFYSSETF